MTNTDRQIPPLGPLLKLAGAGAIIVMVGVIFAPIRLLRGEQFDGTDYLLLVGGLLVWGAYLALLALALGPP